MTNLTEQWKKGELEVGEYYFIRLKSGKIIPQMYSSICIDGHHCTDFALSYGNVQEVLAPVPSYEEWQQMKAFCEEFNALNVAEENQKLKDLLTKAKGVLSVYRISKNQSTYSDKDISGLLTKIDEVLK